MEYILISTVSFFVAMLTLFSGFGMGTALLPVFAIFFPLPIAITATALIHLANNIFKFALVGQYADWKVVVKFALPAAIAAAFGAFSMSWVSNLTVIKSYQIKSVTFDITVLNLIVGGTLIFSSVFELIPSLSKLSFSSKLMPLGGVISGFLGGISGNQGIFRSAFLIKSGLSKNAFIGTGTVASVLVDSVRLIVYSFALYCQKCGFQMTLPMQKILVIATLFAFFGSFLGAKLMHKITFKMIETLVGTMILALGILISIGIV